jgi:hypothetical protein
MEGLLAPLLIHTGQQQLARRITLPLQHPLASGTYAVRLRIAGLCDTLWLLNGAKSLDTNGTITIRNPVNPQLTIEDSAARRRTEYRTTIEILYEGSRVFASDITVLPHCAVPVNQHYALALAALVNPYDLSIVEFIDRVRQVHSSTAKFGQITDLGPIDRAALILDALTAWYELREGREASLLRNKYQLLRNPEEIFSKGEATCVDLSILFASACERLNLSPVILGIKLTSTTWHVVTGVRTRERGFAGDFLNTDLNRINQFCNYLEIHLFDPDGIIRRSTAPASDKLARTRLAAATEAFFIDISSARAAGIWPIPISAPTSRFYRRSTRSPILPAGSSPGSPEERLTEDLSRGRVAVLTGDVLDPGSPRSRQAIARILAERIDHTGAEFDILELGSKYEKLYGRTSLERLLLDHFRALDAVPTSATYSQFASIPFRTVVSFFPDAALESALAHAIPPFRRLLDDRDLATLQPDPNGRELYLLGGSAYSGEGLVLTYADQYKLMLRTKVLGRSLRDRLAEDTHLLIQCDLEAPEQFEIYEVATTHLRPRSRRIYACWSKLPTVWDQPVTALTGTVGEVLRRLSEGAPTHALEQLSSPQISRARLRRDPYKYLDAFNIEDIALFFGRSHDVRRVIQEILSSPSRITILFGRSGVGKTSLVKAGLIPALEHHHNTSSIYARPENDAAVVLAGATKTEKQRLIFFDQIEEIFFGGVSTSVEGFFTAITNAASSRDSTSRIVLIVREDYLARLLALAANAGRVFETVVRVADLSREAAREAILRPAEMCGVPFREELADAILDDLSPDTVFPAHLQIVCDKLYREWAGRGELNLETYERLGRASSILKNYLGEALGHLPSEEQGVARKVLQMLITSRGTRAAVGLTEIATYLQCALAKAEQVLNDLVHRSRLVTQVDGMPNRYELTHDLLAGAVATWIDEADLRVREVQEILSYEVAIARTQGSFKFSVDKLRIIEEYKEKIQLTDEAVIHITQAHLERGTFSEFWRRKLNALSIESQFTVHFGFPALRYEINQYEHLRTVTLEKLELLPPAPFTAELSNALAQCITNDSGEPFSGWLARLTLLDTARTLLGALCERVGQIDLEFLNEVVHSIVATGRWEDADADNLALLAREGFVIARLAADLQERSLYSAARRGQLEKALLNSEWFRPLRDSGSTYDDDSLELLLGADLELLTLIPPVNFEERMAVALAERIGNWYLARPSAWFEALFRLDLSQRMVRRALRRFRELPPNPRIALAAWLRQIADFGQFDRRTLVDGARVLGLSGDLPPSWLHAVRSFSEQEQIYIAIGAWIDDYDDALAEFFEQRGSCLLVLPSREFSFELAALVTEQIIHGPREWLRQGIILLLKDKSGRVLREVAARLGRTFSVRRRLIIRLLAAHISSGTNFSAAAIHIGSALRAIYQQSELRDNLRALTNVLEDRIRTEMVTAGRRLERALIGNVSDEELMFLVSLTPVFGDRSEELLFIDAVTSGDLRRIEIAIRLAVAGPSPAILQRILVQLGDIPVEEVMPVLRIWSTLDDRYGSAFALAVSGVRLVSSVVVEAIIGLGREEWGHVEALLALLGRCRDALIESRLMEEIEHYLKQHRRLDLRWVHLSQELTRLQEGGA